MNNFEIAAKCIDIATNYKTLYILGGIGWRLNESGKQRALNAYEYNRKPARKKKIEAATSDTWAFDCVNLIKSGCFWGWKGDPSKIYGGASYCANGVPDIGADYMIGLCSGVSTNFDHVEVGEAVWKSGHIGIYIGNGLAVECTPAWADGVQITAVNKAKSGYNTRVWTKHGKLPWVKYLPKGDLDFDGEVTTADSRLALRASVSLEHLTPAQVLAADMDNDGQVTAADAREILRISVGKKE